MILGAENIHYNADGAGDDSRNILTNATNNWTIYDGGPLICMAQGTLISTLSGPIAIELLKIGDIILSYIGDEIKIKDLTCVKTNLKYNRLFKIPKNKIKENVPFEDLYLSEGHAIKVDNKWHHMHHTNIGNVHSESGYINYYHIGIDNYFKYTLNANGVEVESYYKINDKEILIWNCNDNEYKYYIL